MDISNSFPIKQHPYRLHPTKASIVKEEVDHMLKNKLIAPSYSPWSSPVVLLPKIMDSTVCFVYRTVNSVTKTDTFPLARMDDYIDRIGNAILISKFDLLKGCWQVPLTERAKAASAFVTSDGLYECEVMLFVRKNAAATYQRLLFIITKDHDSYVVYLDDIVIYSDS